MAPKIIALLDKTQRQAESFGKPYNVYSGLHSFYAYSMGMLGNFEKGKVLFETGINFALKINDLTALAWLESHYGGMLNFNGDAKNAIEHIRNSIRYCEEGQIAFMIWCAMDSIRVGILSTGGTRNCSRVCRERPKDSQRCGSTVSLGVFLWVIKFGLFGIR